MRKRGSFLEESGFEMTDTLSYHRDTKKFRFVSNLRDNLPFRREEKFAGRNVCQVEGIYR